MFESLMSGASGALGSWMVSPGLFLAGAALTALPILIHLLNKRRFKKLDWAAMDFLLEADKRNRRRIRLENLLLLLLRCLAVLLIGLLVARPFLSAGFAAGLLDSARYERIVLLDDSLSMEVRREGRTAFDEAKDQLAGMINALMGSESADSLTLLLASRPDRPLFNDAPINADSAGEMVREIKELSAADRAAPLDAALLEIEKQLGARTASVNRVVYVISDLRHRDWAGDHASSKAEDGRGAVQTLRRISEQTAGCFVVDAADDLTGNLTLSAVASQEKALVSGVAARFEVTVRNNGPSAVGPVPVRFVVGDTLPLAGEIESIPAGQSATLPFTYTFARLEDPLAQEEVQPVRVRAEIDAGLPGEQNRLLADDARYFAARVVPGVPTLIVDGDPSATYGRSESFFLSRALAPPGDFSSGVNVTVATDVEFDSLRLEPFQVIYLCNLYHVTEERTKALEQWVAAGGGLVVMVGDQIDEQLYNQQLFREGAGLLPARLGSIRGDESEERWALLDIEDVQHPVLQVFEGESNPFLQGVKVFRWWETAISDEQAQAGKVSIPARLTDGERSPAIVEKPFGDGRVVLFTIPCDDDWSTWPEDLSYVVAMQELNRYMAPQTAAAGNLAVGEPIRHRFDLTQYKLDVALTGPGRDKAPVQAVPDQQSPPGEESLWRIDFAETDARGFYELEFERIDGRTERLLFAANIDPAEGDLRRIEPAALERELGDAAVQLAGIGSLSSLTAEGAKGELWMYILAALIGVLCLEQFLAWSFGLRR